MNARKTLNLSQKIGQKIVMALAATPLFVASLGHADTAPVPQVIKSSASVPAMDAGWDRSVHVDKFNRPDMVLRSVEIRINGQGQHQYFVENTSSSPASFTAGFSNSYSLVSTLFGGSRNAPDASVLRALGLVAIEASSNAGGAGSLGAWDGSLDFAGRSGVSSPKLASTAQASQTISLKDDGLGAIMNYVGGGDLHFRAASNSRTSLTMSTRQRIARQSTRTGMEVEATYTFVQPQCAKNEAYWVDRLRLDLDIRGLDIGGRRYSEEQVLHLLRRESLDGRSSEGRKAARLVQVVAAAKMSILHGDAQYTLVLGKLNQADRMLRGLSFDRTVVTPAESRMRASIEAMTAEIEAFVQGHKYHPEGACTQG